MLLTSLVSELPAQNGNDFADILSSSSYPNQRDMDISINMSPNAARQNILLCQLKIEAQASEIDRLKRETERQRSIIKHLEALLQENSIKPTERRRSRISR